MSTIQLHTIDDLMAMSGTDRYELIDGGLVKIPLSSWWSSVIGGRILGALATFVDQHELGYVTSAYGGYILSTSPDTVVAPDVGFSLRRHFPEGFPHSGYAQKRPDLAVEVISPSDEPRDMRRKQELYGRAGIPIVWWGDPKKKIVTVHSLGQEPLVKRAGEVLDGSDLLPGFQLNVDDIFKD